MHLPSEDKWYSSKTEMIENIVVLLGGRVAEKVALDDIGTGASNDIERATEIARKMVTQYGMSDKLGPINYGGSAHEVFIGKDLAQSKNYSEEVAAQIDEEIKSIVNSCYERCEKLLREHFETLARVAEALIEREKISGAEFEKLFENVELDDEADGINKENVQTNAETKPEIKNGTDKTGGENMAENTAPENEGAETNKEVK